MILYRSMECIIYHLLLVVVVWLVEMLKNVEKLSGLYGSATICRIVHDTFRALTPPQSILGLCIS